MAAQLIKDMTGKWKAEDYTDTFSAAVQKLVNQKVRAGETESVVPLEDAAAQGAASNVLDLTELLAKSLAKRKPTPTGVVGSAAISAKKARVKLPTRKRA